MAKGQARSTKKTKQRHRARKRTSVPAQKTGIGRDARKAEKRAARRAALELEKLAQDEQAKQAAALDELEG